MAKSFLNLILGLSAIMTVFTGAASADNFEFVSYTTPAGWTNQAVPNGKAYKRANGIGLISIYPSESASAAINPGESAIDSISRDFAKIWRARIEPTLPGAAPQPQFQSEGGYKVAVGAKQVKDPQGVVVTITLTAISGQGRVMGILTMSVGDEVIREISAFLESVKIEPAVASNTMPNGSGTTPNGSGTTPNVGSAAGGGIQMNYEVPPGYTAKNDGGMILLMPPRLETNKCAYWISPPRPSQGSLDADARKAALELAVPGQILNSDRFNAVRGIAPDGWRYSLFGTLKYNSAGTSTGYAMALAMPAGAGQVNIVYGVGDGSSNCYMFDTNFVRLLNSLSLRGWASDGGQAFSRELKGAWLDSAGGAPRYSNNYFLARYEFMGNGRYGTGQGNIVTNGRLETTTSAVSDGSYKLSGNRLTITSDSGNVSRFRVRIYEDSIGGSFMRKIALFNEETNIERDYARIEK